MIEQQLREGIVHEYLEDFAIFETNKQAFATNCATDNFDVAYDGI